MAEMTRKRNLNPVRHRTCPRAVKRWRNEVRLPYYHYSRTCREARREA